eukprot:TRINITY_DN3993_c0_g1_i1.p1 TRINITY_DN3993_c0_g1~~TRINITY_DN3993_c0_g1_i1.p1  ORF type:complete len:2568 (-),score=911.37 TRINITY_DN3993_c0_g1_i1:316-8019(-)
MSVESQVAALSEQAPKSRVKPLLELLAANSNNPDQLVHVFNGLADASANVTDGARDEIVSSGKVLIPSLQMAKQFATAEDLIIAITRCFANLIYDSAENQRTVALDGKAMVTLAQLLKLHSAHDDIPIDILNVFANFTDPDALDELQDAMPTLIKFIAAVTSRPAHVHAAARALAAGATLDLCAGQFKDSGGMEPLRDLIDEYESQPPVLVELMRLASNLSFCLDAAEGMTRSGIGTALVNYVNGPGQAPAVSHITALAVRALCNMARMKGGEFRRVLAFDKMTDFVFDAMENHPKAVPVGYMVGGVGKLASGEMIPAFFDSDGPKLLGDTMKKYAPAAIVQERACDAIWRFILQKHNGKSQHDRQTAFASAEVIGHVSEALRSHVKQPAVVKSGALALAAIGQEHDGNRRKLCELAGAALGDALAEHVDRADAFEACCNALVQASYTEADQVAIGKTAALRGSLDGLDKWIDASDTVSGILGLLVNLTTAEANVAPFVKEEGEDLVLDAMKGFGTDKIVQSRAAQVLGNVGKAAAGKEVVAKKGALKALVDQLGRVGDDPEVAMLSMWAIEQILTKSKANVEIFLSKTDGLQKIAELITTTHAQNEEVVSTGLRALGCVAADPPTVVPQLPKLLPAIARVLKQHKESPPVVLLAMALLLSLSSDASTHTAIAEGGASSTLNAAAEVLASSMSTKAYAQTDAKGQSDLVKTFMRAPRFFGNVARTQSAQPAVHKSGCVPAMLAGLRQMKSVSDVALLVCWAFKTLTADDDDITDDVVDAGGVVGSLDAMSALPEDENVVSNASAFLLNLVNVPSGVKAFAGIGKPAAQTVAKALRDTCHEEGSVGNAAQLCEVMAAVAADRSAVGVLVDGGCVEACVASLKEFYDEEDVAEHSLLALAAMAAGNSGVVASLAKADLVPAVMKALKAHKTSPSVTAAAFACLGNMVAVDAGLQTEFGNSGLVERVVEAMKNEKLAKKSVVQRSLQLLSAMVANEHTANVARCLSGGTIPPMVAAVTMYASEPRVLQEGAVFAANMCSAEKQDEAADQFARLRYPELLGKAMTSHPNDLPLFASHLVAAARMSRACRPGAQECVAAELGRQAVEALAAHGDTDDTVCAAALEAIVGMSFWSDRERVKLERQGVHRQLMKLVQKPPKATRALEALLHAIGNNAIESTGRERYGEAEETLGRLFGLTRQHLSDGIVKELGGWAVCNWAFDHDKPGGEELIDFMAESNPGVEYVTAATTSNAYDETKRKIAIEALALLKNSGQKKKEEEERKRREAEEAERRRREAEEAEKKRAAQDLLDLKRRYEARYQKLLKQYDTNVESQRTHKMQLDVFMMEARERDARQREMLQTLFSDLRVKERQLLDTEQRLTDIRIYSENFGNKAELDAMRDEVEYWKRKAKEAIEERDEHLRDRKKVQEGMAAIEGAKRNIEEEVKRIRVEKQRKEEADEALDKEKRKLQAKIIEVQAAEGSIQDKLDDVQRRRAVIERDEEEMQRRRREFEAWELELEEREKLADKLRQREKELHQYEQELFAREKQDDAMAKDLEMRERALGPREEAISKLELELERKRKELQKREDDLDADERSFDDKEKKLEEREDDLEEKEDEFELRDGKLKVAEEDLQERMTRFEKRVAELKPQLDELDEREQACRVKERDLDEREEKVSDREYAASELEDTLKQKEKDLDEREMNLDSREVRIERLEKAMGPRIAECDRREDEMREREDDLDRRDEEQDERDSELKAKDREIAEREAAFAAREAVLEEREAEVERKTEELQTREAVVEERTSVLDAREEELSVRERDVAEQEKEIERRQAMLEKVQAAADVKMEELAQRQKAVEAAEEELQERRTELEKRQRELDRKEADVKAREDDFANRERGISEREHDLLKNRKLLEDDRDALNKREAQLSTLRRELKDREEVMERDNAKLDKEKEEMKTRRQELQELVDSVAEKVKIAEDAERRKKEIEEWVERQEQAIKDKWHEVHEKQDAVRERERAADQKVEEYKAKMNRMKQECDDRQERMDKKEQELAQNFEQLKEAQGEVEQRLKEVKEQEAELSRQRAEIAEMESTIKSKLRKIEENEEELNKQIAEWKEKEAELQGAMRNRSEYDTDLAARESAMKNREQTLQAEVAAKAAREAADRERMEKKYEAELASKLKKLEEQLRQQFQQEMFELEEQIRKLKSQGHFDSSCMEDDDEPLYTPGMTMSERLKACEERLTQRQKTLAQVRARVVQLESELQAKEREQILNDVQEDDAKIRQKILAQEAEKINQSVAALERIAKRKAIKDDNPDPSPWEKMAVAIENVHAYVLTLSSGGKGDGYLATHSPRAAIDDAKKVGDKSSAEIEKLKEVTNVEDKERLEKSQAGSGLFLNPTQLSVHEVSQTEATLRWSRSADGPSDCAYVVFISRDKMKTWQPVVKTRQQRWRFTDLEIGMVYFLTVMAAPRDGVKQPGEWKQTALTFPTQKENWVKPDVPPEKERFRVHEVDRTWIKMNDNGESLPVKEDAEASAVASAEQAAREKAEREAAEATDKAKRAAEEAETKKGQAELDGTVNDILNS